MEVTSLDKLKIIIISIVSTLLIIGILLVAIPIEEHNKVTYVSWTWSVPFYKYTQHEEKSWYRPPKDAYDIIKKKEYRKTITKTDSKGKTYTEDVYDIRYYYSINKWDYAYCINTTGIDRNPYESVSDIDTYLGDGYPQLGDIKRGNREEKYECNINGIVFEISKDDWNRLEKGCDITYKRHRLSKKIYDIRFN